MRGGRSLWKVLWPLFQQPCGYSAQRVEQLRFARLHPCSSTRWHLSPPPEGRTRFGLCVRLPALPLSHYYEVMRICAQCLCDSIVTSSVCIRSTGLTGSYSNSSFHFSKNCRTDSQNGSANLQASHRPQRKALISPGPHLCVLLSVTVMKAILVGVAGQQAGKGHRGGPGSCGLPDTPLPPHFTHCS